MVIGTNQNHTLLLHAAHSLPVPVNVHVITVEANAVSRDLGIPIISTQRFGSIDPALSSQPSQNREASTAD